MRTKLRISFVTALLAAAIPLTASAEIALRSNWIPNTAGMGDVWTFSCPAGGTFNLTIQNKNDGVSFTGSLLDLNFVVLDSDGVPVAGGDDEVACLNTPACFNCPQTIGAPCAAGGTYSIKVASYLACGSGGEGGGYAIALEVFDAGATALAASKIKLGGGPKSKVPSWHSKTSAPAVDDGPLN